MKFKFITNDSKQEKNKKNKHNKKIYKNSCHSTARNGKREKNIVTKSTLK